MASYQAAGCPVPLRSLGHCIRAIEIKKVSIENLYSKLEQLLADTLINATQEEIRALLSEWLVCGDFLLVPLQIHANYVVGNPPYIRQERLDSQLCKQYREIYCTFRKRADIYVAFYERGLSLMAEEGRLGFICTDRWMKNSYGENLRKHIVDSYHLERVIEMECSDAFHAEVTTYPAITIISKNKRGEQTISERYEGNRHGLRAAVAEGLSGIRVTLPKGKDPWVFNHGDAFAYQMEQKLPTLEEAGCKLGIGVATGADSIFIDEMDKLPVEASRKLPLAMTKDFPDGDLKWRGMGVINPYDETGKLVNPDDYPLFKAYLNKHRERLLKRHCVRKSPDKWYKTIDCIHSGLQKLPKLLIPDIKSRATVGVDEGELYPHHNLYYILPGNWELYALRAFLMSAYAENTISRYCTRMNGDTLRFQAQFLRRLRIPYWNNISKKMQSELTEAGRHGCAQRCSRVVEQCLEEMFYAEEI